MFIKLKFLVISSSTVFIMLMSTSNAQQATGTVPLNIENYEGTLNTNDPNDPLNILIERENAIRIQKRLEEDRMKAYERQLERQAAKKEENASNSTNPETSDDVANINPPN